MKKYFFSIIVTVLFCTAAIAQHENIKFEINNQTFEMVYVGPGTFVMGATPEQGIDLWLNERPTHRVTLSPYFIGKYEVTQELYEAVMGNNPSHFQGNGLPVENVTWIEAEKFVETLNELMHDSLGNRKFALPSEAQWEYAARGGAEGEVYKFSGSDVANDVAWSSENSNDRTHTVGMLKPNELGLYDMSGNVWEWCEDWYRKIPEGKFSNNFHVIRGGGFDCSPRYCRSTNRFMYDQRRRRDLVGLRLAM